ncbi:beta-galactosidase BoGH2A [Muribaculaceae bacterium]|nr:beta-galactosidase BoGH2A [Muribaculaceae bacterium]
MKLNRILVVAALAFMANCALAYSPAGDRIKTEWGEAINPDDVWQVYPRPIMERADWQNLNGLWEYAIVPAQSKQPSEFQGEILVPFCAESSLSGVGKEVGAKNALWYKRNFAVPTAWRGRDVMLNFGAVDWQADVWVNGVKVGSHTGGYTPFSFNISPALNAKGANELVVRVWDPTDEGVQPRGKQVARPNGIWYTPVTGIWQTVWLEPVARVHIENVKILPDIDSNTLTVAASASSSSPSQSVEVIVRDNGKQIASGRSINGEDVVIDMPSDVKLWSPDSPALYDLEISLSDGGKVLDKVSSYAAMRKFSTARDERGIVRMQLNNKPLFQFGPLDQGWWPDGLYTAPSYEALIYDVDKTKDWGFNMIRKHIKVEPAVWYTYCDRKGIIVWQDMPSGDKGPEWIQHRYFDGSERVRSAESEKMYRDEWREIMDCLYNYPCISTWVPFNEAWGQFKTPEIAAWTKAYDPSRLVNPASGGNFYTCGDILDLHNYPAPAMYLFDATRANVLGEYGGIGMAAEGHLWSPERNWGYVQFKSPKEVTDEYVKYARQLLDFIDKGFTGAVYTQTTDVEIEVNGLMTYDRKLIKIDEDRVRQANKSITSSLDNK